MQFGASGRWWGYPKFGRTAGVSRAVGVMVLRLPFEGHLAGPVAVPATVCNNSCSDKHPTGCIGSLVSSTNSRPERPPARPGF